MKAQARYRLRIAHEIRRRDIADAAATHSVRDAARRPSQPIRRALGRSIMRIGERLAAEPSIRPARSR